MGVTGVANDAGVVLWVEAVIAASNGFTSCVNLPDFGSAFGVVWSCGPLGQSFSALDLRYLVVPVGLVRSTGGKKQKGARTKLCSSTSDGVRLDMRSALDAVC